MIFLPLTVISQDHNFVIDKSDSINPWSNLNFNNNPQNFHFAIVADRTGGMRPGIFEDAIVKLNLLQPEFVMSIGDYIEGYTTDDSMLDLQWKVFNGIISHLQMPFFYLPGNHDYINATEARKWSQYFGRSYYHFIYKDVLFLCLNTEEAMMGSDLGGIEKPQFEYFRNVLQRSSDVRWTLVFLHQPLWVQDSTRYWPELEKILSERNHTVFAGHKHNYSKTLRNNGEYYILSTTGGFNQLRGQDKGEFDHLLWITMSEKGPIIGNIKLDGILIDNFVINNK